MNLEKVKDKVEIMRGRALYLSIALTIAIAIELAINALFNINPSYDFYPPNLIIDFVFFFTSVALVTSSIALFIIEFINIYLHPEWG